MAHNDSFVAAHNDSFVAKLICRCDRPIHNAKRTCSICWVPAVVTLKTTSDIWNQRYLWEIFMGQRLDEPIATLKCLSCQRPIITKDRRCVCGLYTSLIVVELETPDTPYEEEYCPYELHLKVDKIGVSDAPEVKVILAETEIPRQDIPPLVMDAETERFLKKEKERVVLRKKAIQLRKNHSYRETAKMLGISLGKLQYLLKKNELLDYYAKKYGW